MARKPIVLCALLASTGIPGWVAAADGPEAIIESVSPQAVTLTPQVRWKTGFLAVNGPDGFRYEQAIEGGSSIELPVVGRDGAALTDGVYRYELSVELEAESAALPSFLIESGEVRIERGLFTAIFSKEGGPASGAEKDEALLVKPGPDNQAAGVENHFTADLGTTRQICAGCSSTFEPDDEPLHLIGAEPGIRFQSDETTSPSLLWEVDVTTSDRFVIEDSDGTDIFNVESGADANLLYLSGDSVGIGTSTPSDAELHIQDHLDATIRVKTTSSSAADWRFGTYTGNFFIQDLSQATDPWPFIIRRGAPSLALVIEKDGEIGLGTTYPEARLHVAGGAVIDGDVSIGSSRELKHDLIAADPKQVLKTVLDLPIYRWRYRDDPYQSAHVGPMAEDWHSGFGLGRDAKHLSPADSAGIALAALQGLEERTSREIEELRRQSSELAQVNSDLRSANRELLRRLAAIEELLSRNAER